MLAYEHGGDIYDKSGVELDFSVNTNPLGMPAEVREALVSRVDEFTRYPDPYCRELRAAIAAHEDVPESFVLTGCGAVDLIHRLCRVIAPRNALVTAPAFSEYQRALSLAGCEADFHQLRGGDDFALTYRILKHLEAGFGMLFLCNPNNPAGGLISRELLERILRAAHLSGAVCVVDECFLDFTDGLSAKRYLEEMPGLVVLKAFTKLYAMAGLRLGYMLCSNLNLISKTESAAPPWSVSAPAQIAGAAALGCAGWAEKTRLLVRGERELLTKGLRGLGVTVFKSDANFLLLRSERPLYEPLLREGILVRRCGNFTGLDGTYYRVAVKTREENIRLTEAVKEALHG